MSIAIRDSDSSLNAGAKKHIAPTLITHSENQPLALMTLDLLGFVVIFIGLAHQYGSIQVLPASLSFSYSGLVIALLGVSMTLPFFAWSLKACCRTLSKISD